MKLKIKEIAFESKESTALLHEKDAKLLNVNVGDRVLVLNDKKKTTFEADSTLNLASAGKICISKESMKYLGVSPGSSVEVFPAQNSKGVGLIFKKLNGIELKKEEILIIIEEIVNNLLTEAEIAYFVSAVYEKGMSLNETIYLTEAIHQTGQTLHWSNKKIADKHSIGGIAGNRTTPIVISICAAAGITMPKTSSRAITSAAGTADVIETITGINFSAEKLQKIVKKVGACLAWGGSLGLAPADDKLIRVERLLNVDPEAQLIASILAKKLSVGSKYILIDIPYGKYAKVSKSKAISLKKKFFAVGKHFNLNLVVVLTDGSQPIGNGIGPVLEIIDVIKVLKRDNPPLDLEKKSLMLAGIILEMLGKAEKGKGEIKAKKILDSGKALTKFEEIIEAQGKKKATLKLAKYKYDFKSSKNGKIKSIDNKAINNLAEILGCPSSKSAGIYLYKHNRDKVKAGECLATLYSESESKLSEALLFIKTAKPFEIN